MEDHGSVITFERKLLDAVVDRLAPYVMPYGA
jgi:hypothetical protein